MPQNPDTTVVLRTGEALSEQAVNSPDGRFSVVHQYDGDVVVRRNADGLVIWRTGTGYRESFTDEIEPGDETDEKFSGAGRLVLRDDNTLAVLNHEGAELWCTPTREYPYLSLVLGNSGVLTLMSRYGHQVWHSKQPPVSWDGWNQVADGHRLRRGQNLRGHTLTSDNGQYALVASAGGWLHLRRVGGPVLWARFMGENYGLTLTDEGSFCDRRPDGSVHPLIWHDNPVHIGAFEMYVADDGRITAVDEAGKPLWVGPDPAEPLPEEEDEEAEPPRVLRTSDRPPIDLSDYDEFSALVVRTDFDDPAAWARVSAELVERDPNSASDDAPTPFVVDDPIWAGAHWEEVVTALPPDEAPHAVFVADTVTMKDEGLLIANVRRLLDPDEDDENDYPDHGRVFVTGADGIAVNLALANMDFEDFVERPDYFGHDQGL